MTLQQRINAFVQLGNFLRQFAQKGIEKGENILNNELFFDGMKHQIKLASEHNGWFTKENILFALYGWASLLTQEKLESWLAGYDFPESTGAKNTNKKKGLANRGTTVAVIMAGNIPLVGFHDFLCVLLSGKNFVGKQSSNDTHLLPYIAKYLEYAEPQFRGSIQFTNKKLEDYHGVIATGSNNTARYFEYYFGDKPTIIRKNRNSVAVLTGKETAEELSRLGEDIFRYFGLGCRSVSKLLVPKDYNFDAFFKAIYPWHEIIEQAKYANNYDYNKAVYLMSLFDILENGFLMIKEDKNYGSPIATLFYEHYESQDDLIDRLTEDEEKIQCIVTAQGEPDNFRRSDTKGLVAKYVSFGKTQKPELHDYADGVDTIAFLLDI